MMRDKRSQRLGALAITSRIIRVAPQVHVQTDQPETILAPNPLNHRLGGPIFERASESALRQSRAPCC
jgi:hypothetical protein